MINELSAEQIQNLKMLRDYLASGFDLATETLAAADAVGEGE